MLTRPIPSSGEQIPVIGLGTWQTFDVPQPNTALENVLNTMHKAGGALIDSSPMYGRSEEIVGDITSQMPHANDFFYATKVWIKGREEGIAQMEASMRKMQRTTIDVMQIHNLTDWKTHLATLRDWQEEGKIRYIGITHYTDGMHEELERIMRTEKLDFVQFNYSITSRHAEKSLLSAAADLGIATLINRPLGEGRLMARTKGKPLPPWAADLDIHSWSAFFLKFIIANPAVTCVIPATSNPAHAADNFAAGEGSLPDGAARNKMTDHVMGL